MTTTTTALSTYESEKNRKRSLCELKRRNVVLINFDFIIELAYFNFNKHVYDMNIKEDFFNKDVKNLFYNFVIYELCEFIKHRGVSLKPLIFFSIRNENRLLTNDKQFEKVIVYITNKIPKILPIVVIKSELNFSTFKQHLVKRDPTCLSILEKNIETANTFDITTISFRKLKIFFKKHGLTFLDNTYFKMLQTKLLFIT